MPSLRLTFPRLLCAALIAGPGTALAAPPLPPLEPEAATGYTAQVTVSARKQMVVAAHPLAAEAGQRILMQGGSALDAAIAVQAMLTLVEPQSSGIGGGAFLLHFDARHKTVLAWDGRETAPAAVDANLFIGSAGVPMGFHAAAVGGRAVGVPGVLRMLEAAHARHGRLPWARLFEPAIQRAREGFTVSPRLHTLLSLDPFLRQDPAARAYFYDQEGAPWPVGHRLRNPALADTLTQIAQRGSLALHAGPIAADLVDAVQAHPRNPGRLSARDLAFYTPVVRRPVCSPYLRWVVCGMPAPSSGGTAVAQILALTALRGAPPLSSPDGQLDARAVHLYAEASALAYADRDRYLADPDYSVVPAGLLDRRYLASRAARIGERSEGIAPAGEPPGARPQGIAGVAPEQPSTSHLSIMDAQGNAVSMTTTIEDQFGARIMVRGFLLNNQLTDFSFVPKAGGSTVANRIEPGKRPRSSMSPTLVFESAGGPEDGPRRGRLVMVIGSPGGAQIIGYVARTLLLTLGAGLPLQQAIDLPNVGDRNGPIEVEAGRIPVELVTALKARGHEIVERPMTSGLHGIVRHCDRAGRCTLSGGADPRREGRVLGR